MTPQPSPTPDRDLQAGILSDLDFAARAVADLDAACQDNDPKRIRGARNEIVCAIAWVRDRLGHAAGEPCLMPRLSGLCIVEAEEAAS
jgi:hypothetical protein